MTKKEFIKLIPPDSLRLKAINEGRMVILRCNCGEECCQGWAFVFNNKEDIKVHRQINKWAKEIKINT